MSNEHQPNFEKDLAQAATPEEFDGEKIEATHDPAESLRIGLVKLYYNYSQEIANQLMSGSIDENGAKELTAQVDRLSLADLGYEISKGIPLEIAKEIMGPNMCFGPDEVRKAGIEIKEEIPPIPFSSEELKRAKELGQMLIYRTSTTMKELNDTISPIFINQDKGKVLTDPFWYNEKVFYKSEHIQPGWVLVSKELTPGSTGRDYLEQTEFLAEYLVNEVFRGKPLPRKYQEAIDQLNDQKVTIRLLMASDEDTDKLIAVRKMINLKVNQFFRQSPAEVIYDYIVYFQNTGERLHIDDNVWTNTQSVHDRLVFVGDASDCGVSVFGYRISGINRRVGASFTRRGADLKS